MDGDPTRIRIIHAREESLADINGLIARSKSHWSWPEGYLNEALPLHRVSPVHVRNNHCYEVLDTHDKLIAFFALAVDGTRVLLDNLWVTPDLIGNGIGRQACEHVFQLAREQGWAAALSLACFTGGWLTSTLERRCGVTPRPPSYDRGAQVEGHTQRR